VNQYILLQTSTANIIGATAVRKITLKIDVSRMKKDLKEMNAGREMPLCAYESTLLAHAKSEGLLQNYTFIADSRHMVHDKNMFDNSMPHASIVKVGNDSKLQVKSIGTYYSHTIDNNGEKVNIKIHVFELMLIYFHLLRLYLNLEYSLWD
jgi:hypothetical protein